MKIDPIPFADFPVVVAFTFNGPVSEVWKIADYVGEVLTEGLCNELEFASSFLELRLAQESERPTHYQISARFLGAVL